MCWPTLYGVICAFALATASTVVLLRAMEERRLLETRRGRIAVGWLIVEDLACVLALVLMPVIASVLGTSCEKAITFGDVVVKILTTLIQLGLFVGVMLVVGRRLIPWLLEHKIGRAHV